MDRMWGADVSRERLLQKITLLTMIGPIPEEPRRHQLVSPPDFRRILTIEQEAEVAGNLAFLSRRSTETHNVAAIGIEEDEGGRAWWSE